MAIEQCIKIPIIYEALQWRGDNFDECETFINELCQRDVEYRLEQDKIAFETGRTIGGSRTIKLASKGDFLIRNSTLPIGVHMALHPEIYKACYVKLPHWVSSDGL